MDKATEKIWREEAQRLETSVAPWAYCVRELFAEIDELRDETVREELCQALGVWIGTGWEGLKDRIEADKGIQKWHKEAAQRLTEQNIELNEEIDELRSERNEHITDTETMRANLSEAIGLGNGAPWGAIKDHATELAALYAHTYNTDGDGLSPRREKYLRDVAGPGRSGYPTQAFMRELFAEIDRLRRVTDCAVTSQCRDMKPGTICGPGCLMPVCARQAARQVPRDVSGGPDSTTERARVREATREEIAELFRHFLQELE